MSRFAFDVTMARHEGVLERQYRLDNSPVGGRLMAAYTPRLDDHFIRDIRIFALGVLIGLLKRSPGVLDARIIKGPLPNTRRLLREKTIIGFALAVTPDTDLQALDRDVEAVLRDWLGPDAQVQLDRIATR